MWFWEMLKATFREWWNDNTFRMSAALAFYMIFSLSPLLVIAIATVGLFVGPEQAQARIAAEIGTLAGHEAEVAVREVGEKTELITGSPLAMLAGIGALFVGSTVVFAELQSALNQIWDVEAHPEKSGLWKLLRDRVLSFGLVLAVAFLLLVSLLISTGLSVAQSYLVLESPVMAVMWQTVNMVVAVFIVGVLFALIYRFLPDVKIHWLDVAVGAAVTSVLFNAGKYLIGVYLGRMAIGSTYGTAGAVGVFLIWVYYSALICFFGAEFTQVYTRRYGSGIRPTSLAVRTGHKRA